MTAHSDITWTDETRGSAPVIRTALIQADEVPAALRSLAHMLEDDDWLDLVNLTVACHTETEGFQIEAVLTDSAP
jgi:hypothetical protein